MSASSLGRLRGVDEVCLQPAGLESFPHSCYRPQKGALIGPTYFLPPRPSYPPAPPHETRLARNRRPLRVSETGYVWSGSVAGGSSTGGGSGMPGPSGAGSGASPGASGRSGPSGGGRSGASGGTGSIVSGAAAPMALSYPSRFGGKRDLAGLDAVLAGTAGGGRPPRSSASQGSRGATTSPTPPPGTPASSRPTGGCPPCASTPPFALG